MESILTVLVRWDTAERQSSAVLRGVFATQLLWPLTREASGSELLSICLPAPRCSLRSGECAESSISVTSYWERCIDLMCLDNQILFCLLNAQDGRKCLSPCGTAVTLGK